MIRNYLLFCLLFSTFSASAWFHNFFGPPMVKPEYIVTIMLDPAGDAQNTGRVIDDSFERTLTAHYAERLKMILEDEHSHIRVLLTREPGQTLQPLLNANYANRANVDLYIHISFYKEQSVKPSLYLYTFNNSPIVTRHSTLAFVPYDQAHMLSYNDTQRLSTMLKKNLENEPYSKFCECKGIYATPFKPLIGIQRPALGLEIGLKTAASWGDFIEPIALSLKPIIKTIQKNHEA